MVKHKTSSCWNKKGFIPACVGHVKKSKGKKKHCKYGKVKGKNKCRKSSKHR